MESFNEKAGRDLSREADTFLQKTARSLVEIQPNLHTVTDIVVFLEVLGYTNKQVAEKGFRDLYDFAGHLYEFIDQYADKRLPEQRSADLPAAQISSRSRRVGEALALAFPWLSSLIVLLVFGVSLWLVWGLPISITTSLIIGLFLGLVASEGPMQLFQRLFVFHYAQGNLPEVKRVLKRSYYVMMVLIAGVTGLIFAGGLLTGVPSSLIVLSAIAAVTMLTNRVSYIALYALKRFSQLVTSYSLAIFSLLAVFFLLYNFIPHTLTRYLDSLGIAFIVLSIAPAYYGYKIFFAHSTASLTDETRSSLNPLIVNSRTIRSIFSVQVWENASYYLFGTLFFVMLFGDRVLSWWFNPVHVANGVRLPLVFNTAYHLGADLALLIIFPAAIVQYVMMTPISEELSDLAARTRVSEGATIERFLKRRYSLLILASVLASSLIAAILFFFAPEIMARIGGSALSARILRIAAVSNVLLSIFTANALFLMFMNRAKSLVVIASVCVCILGIGGYLLAAHGFQNIVDAYLVSAVVAMALSFTEVARVWDDMGSRYFSKYT